MSEPQESAVTDETQHETDDDPLADAAEGAADVLREFMAEADRGAREMASITAKALDLLGGWCEHAGGECTTNDCPTVEKVLDEFQASEDAELETDGLCLYCMSRLVRTHYKMARQRANMALAETIGTEPGISVGVVEAMDIDARCPCGGSLFLSPAPNPLVEQMGRSGFNTVCLVVCVAGDDDETPGITHVPDDVREQGLRAATPVMLVCADEDVERADLDDHHDIPATVETVAATALKDTRPHTPDDFVRLALKKGGGFSLLARDDDDVRLVFREEAS